jgi:hypothetical protein
LKYINTTPETKVNQQTVPMTNLYPGDVYVYGNNNNQHVDQNNEQSYRSGGKINVNNVGVNNNESHVIVVDNGYRLGENVKSPNRNNNFV